MAIMQRTRGIFNQMVNDVRRVVFWTNIIVQSIFFVFYGFSIYESIQNIPFLILYSILLLISIITYITFLVVNIKKLNKPKNFNRALRIFKYFANGTMLILNVIDMIKFGASDLNKILLALSGISIFAQIIVEFARAYVERYTDLIKIALEEDLGILAKLDEIRDVKGNFLKLVNKPLQSLAEKFESVDSPEDKKKLFIAEKSEEYEQKLKEKAKKKKEIAKERNAEKVKTAKQDIKKNWGVIKEHIFKKKKKEEDAN